MASCVASAPPADSGAPGDARPALEGPAGFCDALADVACEAWGRCGCGEALGWWDVDACAAVARLECTSAIATVDVEDAIRRGDVVFDSAAAERILGSATSAGSAGCARQTIELGAMLVGARGVGAPCARVGDAVDTCGVGLACVLGSCTEARPSGLGEGCPCADGLECDASVAPGGVCTPATTAGLGVAGDACLDASECASALCIERCVPAACRWTLRADGDAWLVLPGP